MTQPPPIGSPLWWLLRLNDRLGKERPRLDLLDQYYWGQHPLPEIPKELNEKYLVQFTTVLQQSTVNFMQMVVDAKANRARAQGFRLSASEDEQADLGAWDIWQAAGMDGEHRLGIRDSLTKGRGAISAWYPDKGSQYARLAIEDACQTIVENVPGDRRKRAAALKVWVDDWTGTDRANVYLPDGIYKFKRVRPPESVTTPVSGAVVPPGQGEWVELTTESQANPLGIVPIIPLIPRPDAYGRGHSVIEGVLPIQDRLNGTVFNRVLAGWFAAFRQKWATGVEIPVDAAGQPVEPWSQAITRMFVDESENARFGTFDATDLTQYLKAEEQDIKNIASITFTPRHFLIQQGQEPSGDAVNSAEAPLNADVMNIESNLSEPFEEAIRLARLFQGEKDSPVDSEIVWADPRDPAIVEAARTDAIIKQYQAGLITTTLAQEKLGRTPQEIERMSTELRQKRLEEAGAALVGEMVNGARGTPAGAVEPAS